MAYVLSVYLNNKLKFKNVRGIIRNFEQENSLLKEMQMKLYNSMLTYKFEM